MIRLLSNNDREVVLDYVRKNPIETAFLVGNVINFGLDNDKTTRRCGDYYGYFEDDILKGILPFYNLGSCIPHFESSSAVPFFAEIIKDSEFKTLLGMERFIKPIYENVKNAKEASKYSESSYYVNKNFNPYFVDGAEFKDADSSRDDMIDFTVYAYNYGFNQNRDYEGIKSMFGSRPDEEDFIFMYVNNKIVAQCCIQTTSGKINQIGGVYTSEEYRGRGYCKALVSEMCRRIIERGNLPTLMVKKLNVPAVRAYQSIGFENYDDYLIIEF